MRKWSFLLILTGFVLSLMCSVSSDAKEYSYKGETLHFSKGVLRNYKECCVWLSPKRTAKNCRGSDVSMWNRHLVSESRVRIMWPRFLTEKKRIYVDGKQVHLSQAAKELPNKKEPHHAGPFLKNS